MPYASDHGFSIAGQLPVATLDSDPSLVRTVFDETVGCFALSAGLNRFGGLAVFVTNTGTGVCLWQGENILAARDWIAGQLQCSPGLADATLTPAERALDLSRRSAEAEARGDKASAERLAALGLRLARLAAGSAARRAVRPFADRG